MEGGAVCLTCGTTFKSLANANRHYKERHLAVPGRKYQCHICGRSYMHARVRNEHLAKVHNIRKLTGTPQIPQVYDNQEEYY